MLEPAHKSRYCVLKPAYFTTISSFFFKILLYSFLSAVEKLVLFAPTSLRALWDFLLYHSHKPCYNKHSCSCFSHSLSLFLKSHLWSFLPGQGKKKKKRGLMIQNVCRLYDDRSKMQEGYLCLKSMYLETINVIVSSYQQGPERTY